MRVIDKTMEGAVCIWTSCALPGRTIVMKIVQSRKSPKMVRHAEIPFLEESLCLIADTQFFWARSDYSELFGAGRRQEDRGVDGEEEHCQLEREAEDGWDKQDRLHPEDSSDCFLDEFCCLFHFSQPVFGRS